MKKEEIISRFNKILTSDNISKYQDMVGLLRSGLSKLIYEELKAGSDHTLSQFRKLNPVAPRQALYIWHNVYLSLCNEERINRRRVPFGTLYFSIADVLFTLDKTGYGKFYLNSIPDFGL